MLATIRALLKRWGTTAWKQRVWDDEYKGGAWTHGIAGGHGPRDSVLGVIEKYAAGGDILELGCGGGETAFEIAETYRRYVGVDISGTAIRQGSVTAAQYPSRADKIALVVGDIANYVPAGTFAVILFRESIYYLPKLKIGSTLRRLSSFLSPDGVFIVRLHDRMKYQHIIRTIEEDYRVVERSLPEGAATATLVFRPQQT